MDQRVDPRVAEQLLRARLQAIAGRLEAIANDRVNKRRPHEARWIEDLEQYHGRYDGKTAEQLKTSGLSQVFTNLTRPKTDAMSARLMDLLYPTDDKNWGIQPTPVPALAQQAKEAASQAQMLIQQAEAMQKQQGADPAQMAETEAQKNAAVEASNQLRGVVEEARRRSELMAEEIDDQLKESNDQAVSRDVIDCACKLGTGVAKGPITGDRIRKGWQKDQTGAYSLQMAEGNQPGMRYVDIWSFFPDPDVANINDGEGVFERHIWNGKKVRQLAQMQGFDKAAIRRLLVDKPRGGPPSYMAELRSITGESVQTTGDFYHVWEYTGCLSAEDMLDLAIAMGDEDTQNELYEVDPLKELNAVVWFCQNEVLKFSIYPYDSGECLYSVFNLVKDESSIFGYGIPAIMRDPQRMVNGAVRAMMDNGGLSAGPQFVIDLNRIAPADGNYKIYPRKIWKPTGEGTIDETVFQVFNIPTMQEALSAIAQMGVEFIDIMTQMPALAQGEQGSGVTKTAQGMAILMNSASVVFRRIVKNYDDDMTTPKIRRFYDWNMQFNEKQEIKGDYQVDARGSSVLLVREMQANNLFNLALQIGGHPEFGMMLKKRELLKMLFKANMIPADEVLLSDAEIQAVLAKAQAAAQQQPAGPNPEIEQMRIEFEREKLGAMMELENLKAANAKELAEIQRESAMMQVAEKLNMNADQLAAKLQMKREEIGSKERSLAVESAMVERTGQHAGGAV